MTVILIVIGAGQDLEIRGRVETIQTTTMLIVESTQNIKKSPGDITGARQYFSDTLVFDFPSTIEWRNSFNRIA